MNLKLARKSKGIILKKVRTLSILTLFSPIQNKLPWGALAQGFEHTPVWVMAAREHPL
jgi:hypothetical protein